MAVSCCGFRWPWGCCPHTASHHCSQVTRLKQALQDSQAERDGALLERDVMLQRLRGLEEEADAKRRSQDDRSRQLKALEVGWDT